MDPKKIRLVVSDMDGTLLNSKGEIPAAFPSLLERMKRNGVTFCAASGRQIFNIKTKFPDMRDGIYFIAENGAYATYGDETLIELAISREDVKNFRETAIGIPNTHIVLSGKRNAYIEAHDPDFLARLRSYSGHLKETRDVSQIEDDTFFKFTLCDFDNPLKNSLPRFVKFRGEFQVESSGPRWMDITRKEANKAAAVRLIQRRLGITPEETVVFGDYLNDLRMIEECPNAYAMANAIDAVKKAAKNEAPSCEDGGVAEVLDRMLPA